MILFKTLKAEGFGCHVRFKRFVLNQPGINIITGKNGIGKTTLFNEVYWTLFGKSIKEGSDIATWEHLRGDDWVGTMTSLTFIKDDVKYKVIRCLDYELTVEGIKGKNRLIILRSGVELPIRDKRVMQRKLEEILGFGPDLFIHAIMFPQGGKRFIEETGPKKKEILEKAFNLTWISDVADQLKHERTNIKVEMDKLLTGVTNKQATLASYKEMLDEIKTNKATFDADQEADLKAWQKKIDTAESERDELRWDEKIYDQNTSRKDTIKEELAIEKSKPKYINAQAARSKQAVEEASLKREEKQVKSLKVLIENAKATETCPTCGQEMGKEKHKEHLRTLKGQKITAQEKVSILQQSIGMLIEDTIQAQGIEINIKALDLELSELRITIGEEEKTKIKYDNYTDNIESHKKSKEKERDKVFQDTSKTIKTKKKALKKEYKVEKARHEEVSEKYDLHDWALKGPFGNSGLKTYLFDILLDKLNNRLEYYSQYTGFTIEIIIDTAGSRENIRAIITRDTFPVQYEDLSAGQKQISNLVLGFAQADILVKENPTNLWCGDEILESLDEDNVEKVADFLNTFFTNERSIFIVTHKTTFRPSGSNLINISADE